MKRNKFFTRKMSMKSHARLIMAVVMLLMLLPIASLRAYGQTTPRTWVDLTDGVLTFHYSVKDKLGDNEYSLPIPGNFPAWQGKNGDITKVVFLPEFADARPTSTHKWFYRMPKLTTIEGLEYLNTSEVTNMNRMFYELGSLTELDLSHFDTHNVKDMGSMFQNCTNLKTLNLSHFDTSKVTNMSYMFYATGIVSLDLSSFDTSNVTNMQYMFASCSQLKNLYVGDKFSVGNVQSGNDMFGYATQIEGARTYDAANTSAYMANIANGYVQKIVGYQGDEPIGAAGDPLKIVHLDIKDKTPITITDNTVVGVKHASYSRKVTSNWGTICLPFAIDVDDTDNDCWFYPLTEVLLDEGRIPVKRMKKGTIAAGVPMFVKRKDEIQTSIHIVGEETVNGVSMASEPANSSTGDRLIGTFYAIAAPESNNVYFIAKDKFRSVMEWTGKDDTKGVKVYGYRAYILTDENNSSSKPSILTINETEGTTGIYNNLSDCAKKPILFYDLQGRRLTAPRKGVSIIKEGNSVRKIFTP